MIRPQTFRSAMPRPAMLVVTLWALTISCLASPTGTGVLLVTPPAASVAVGDAVRLTAIPQDDGTGTVRAPTVTWTSSDPSVATVDATGLVNSLGLGSATISVMDAEEWV